jgi:translation initiation factor 1
VVRIRREIKGRKGKGVTTVSGVPLDADALKRLAARLKRSCGTGGSVKDGVIVIQGDHRAAIQEYLQDHGFKAKLAGG